MAPVPADSSVCCETGGAGAATQLALLEADQVSWPSDAEMTVLRVKARGQSILGDGGHLFWPTAIPRVIPPIPPSSAVVAEDTGSLVNWAEPSPDVAPDGETLLVPMSSWSATSMDLSDIVTTPPQIPAVDRGMNIGVWSSPRPKAEDEPKVKVEEEDVLEVTSKTASIQADFSRPATPRTRTWREIFTNLCCGGGTD